MDFLWIILWINLWIFYGNFMASLVPVSNFEVKTLPAPYAADPSAVQFGA